MREPRPRVAVFGPNPLLSVTVEARGGSGDDVHLHPGGQGVWVARMAAELGAEPVLCGFAGGETGTLLSGLLARVPCEPRLVPAAGASGCCVFDRRSGERKLVANAQSPPPSRHEVDDLFSTTTAAALDADVLAVCNPLPGDSLPLELYRDLVTDVRASGTPVLVDLSAPRLNAALEGEPDLVKLNDWELAEYICGPVSEPGELRAAAERLHDAGAGTVVVTRGPDPALVLHGDEAWELVPPRFDRGAREGCGDSMMGALAAGWAAGMDLRPNLVRGAAAGAANFLRHGLGTGSRDVIDQLTPRVVERALASAA